MRVGALADEGPARLVGRVGDDMFMFGSDWPHAEGIAEPLAGYEPVIEGLARTRPAHGWQRALAAAPGLTRR